MGQLEISTHWGSPVWKKTSAPVPTPTPQQTKLQGKNNVLSLEGSFFSFSFKKKERKEVLVSPHSRMLVGLLSAFQARLWAFPPGILLVSGAWSWWGHSCQGHQGQTRVSGWDFPGSQEVKTELPLQEAQVRSLVRELRSHMPWGQYKERHLPPSPKKTP